MQQQIADGRCWYGARSTHLISAPLHLSGAESCASLLQVGGKIVVATTGGSPQQPSELALLEVGSVEELKTAGPDQWRTLRKSTTLEASAVPAQAHEDAAWPEDCAVGSEWQTSFECLAPCWHCVAVAYNPLQTLA